MNDIIAAELKRIIYEAVRDALQTQQARPHKCPPQRPVPEPQAELPPVMSPKTLAEYLDVSITTISRWRATKIGPPYFESKGLNMIRYRREDVLDWINNAMVAKRS